MSEWAYIEEQCRNKCVWLKQWIEMGNLTIPNYTDMESENAEADDW